MKEIPILTGPISGARLTIRLYEDHTFRTDKRTPEELLEQAKERGKGGKHQQEGERKPSTYGMDLEPTGLEPEGIVMDNRISVSEDALIDKLL